MRLLVDEATAREEELQALVVELQGNLENIADFKQRKDDVENELVGAAASPHTHTRGGFSAVEVGRSGGLASRGRLLSPGGCAGR